MSVGGRPLRLVLEYEPEGVVEKVGDRLNIVENQAKADLDRFKTFIESEGYASGAWRESVNGNGNAATAGIAHADASRGDSGKAGVSGKAVAAAAGWPPRRSPRRSPSRTTCRNCRSGRHDLRAVAQR